MKKSTSLSICIPTHNRKDFLANTIKKIINSKNVGKLEIVIGDDASTDGTSQIVKELSGQLGNINLIYKKFNKRLYFDKMVLSIVKLAHGDFCWLISDDDIPLPGSILKVKKIISEHPNVSLIHTNYERFDNILKKITSKKMVRGINKNIYFKSASDFFFKPIKNSYFEFLGINIITMSTNIFNRKKWLSMEKGLHRFIGYNFIHCFVLSAIIKKYPEIYYISKASVRYLSNNHRIWPNDIWKDYNSVFLNYLGDIGYPKSKTFAVRNAQSKYEGRDSIMKNPLLKNLYLLARPIYARLQYLKSRYVGN